MAVSAAQAQSSGLETYWDNGLKFRSEDKAYEFAIGGRVHYDLIFQRQQSVLDTLGEILPNKLDIRRARLTFNGRINEAFSYEFEFAFGEAIRFADMYFRFERVPFVDMITVGHFREPFGLEELTNSNVIVFMERSLTSAFGPSRNAGIMLQKQVWENKLGIYTSFFRITDAQASDTEGDQNYSFTSRVALNPILDEDANRALHAGVAVTTRTPRRNEFELESSNETYTGLRYVSTGNLQDVEYMRQLGAEAGYSLGPLTLQTEYVHAFLGLSRINDALVNKPVREFSSYYASLSYFLGGRRTYQRNGYQFSTIEVDKPYHRSGGPGAWEFGLRFAQLNLLDTDRHLAQMRDATVGINWYYNATSRFMLNYVLTNVQQDYWANALQLRLQVTF